MKIAQSSIFNCIKKKFGSCKYFIQTEIQCAISKTLEDIDFTQLYNLGRNV